MTKNPVWAVFNKKRRRYDRELLKDWILAIEFDSRS
jgi:hypothetical protein